MNILFHTFGKVSSTKGGTERTTITVATGLTHYAGCRCFSIYEEDAPSPKEDCFVDEFQWTVVKSEEANARAIRDIIMRNHIDCVIVQGAFIHVKRFRAAISGLDCELIFAHHFAPAWECAYFKLKDVVRSKPRDARGIARKIYQLVAYPLVRHQYVSRLAASYREAYENADRVVLLSEKYIKPFQEFGGFNDAQKFRIIPNALSFTEIMDEGALSGKKKIALIVSRLDERPKKLSAAFKIWELVKQDAIAREWQLKVVGHGADEERYKKMVKEQEIPDVIFCGRQNPQPYYREAALFMMTSRSESWGLTLTEAQQLGCVPIAFNTYPTLTDIITDGRDGLVIPADDINAYAATMLQLMTDDNRRREMATQGFHTCQRFAQDKIIERWRDLLNE